MRHRYRGYPAIRDRVQVDPVTIEELMAQILLRIQWHKDCGENTLRDVWLILKRPDGGVLTGYYLPTPAEKTEITKQLRDLGYTVDSQPDSSRNHPMVAAQTNIYWS